MARNRNLAGLAALGALGYMMAKGGKKSAGEEAATIEERGTMPRSPALADSSSDFESQIREHEGGIGLQASTLGRAPAAVAPTRSMAPAATAATAAIPAEVPSRGRREMPARRNVAGDYTRKMGATAEEIAAYRNREITPPRMTPEMRRQAEAQALERVTPEEYLVGGPGLKTLHAAAKRLAAPRLAEYSPTMLPAPVPRLPAPGMKKGGAVRAKTSTVKMASGGSTSSASRRGDGIAQRGKTRGRMR